MLSKSLWRARTAVWAVLLVGCRSVTPWHNEPIGNEINLSFTVQNNLLFLSSARVDGREGRYFLGTAHARSVLDPAFGASGTHEVQFGEKESSRITPAMLDLGGVGDAIIGADAWGRYAVTVDYVSGLVTVQKEGIHPAEMTLYRYRAEPAVNIFVDGRQIAAVVDTASPDTLVLPGANGRAHAHLRVGGVDFGTVDIRYGDVTRPRLGNRVLSKFLVTVDYGRQMVGLWRDPRTR